MNTPQILVAIMLIIGTLTSTYVSALDKDLTAGGATAVIMLRLAIKTAYVILLHFGGFW